MEKKVLVALVSVTLILVAYIPAETIEAADYSLTVDLSTDTGSVMHGAVGFLYGFGNEGIPSDNVTAPLSLTHASQKPPNGAQHPDGDVFDVQEQFFRNGGDKIQVIMQDIYQQWPYEDLGIHDYMNKVDTMVNQLASDPHSDHYVYVPFNEPDFIWYNTGNQFQEFLQDWETIYNQIKSIDPDAIIGGPNFATYNPDAMAGFMEYARDHDVLPDVVTWHELGNDFFTDWYNHYDHYRGIEANLGISERLISINEYGRIHTDESVPGNMVQFISKFENSKVLGSIAFWGTAGSLNELVAENNRATGAWWLYKWYSDLSGHTVQVIPPSLNSSLQGVAALDASKNQARLVFGGAPSTNDVFDTDVVIQGLSSVSGFGNAVHVTVWGVDDSGPDAGDGPYKVHESRYTASGGQITVPVTGMQGSSAYHMIITPDTSLAPVQSDRYEAEYASVSGTAFVSHGAESGYSGTGFVEGYGGSTTAGTQFVVSVDNNGYYDVTLRYAAGPLSGAPNDRETRLVVNNTHLADLMLPGTPDWSSWNSVTTTIFLEKGINRVNFEAFTTGESDAINIDYMELTPAGGTIDRYEAEDVQNTLGGTAVVESDSAASGGEYVGWIGGGSANYLQFNNIYVPESGLYKMVVTHANNEQWDQHAYNDDLVDRYADIRVNGGPVEKRYFRNTQGWSTYHTAVVEVDLHAGDNTIHFSNSTHYTPNIDKIEIAAAVAGQPSGGTGEFDPDADYAIINEYSGLALDNYNWGTSNGSNVVQWDNWGGEPQRWHIYAD